jgi:hypothetical protein
MVLGVVTSETSGPAVAVTVAVAGAETPVAYAVSSTLPVFVPRVTVVVATPAASDIADEGAKVIPPPPEAKKFTTIPETAFPFASATFTPKAPIDERTVPLAVGGEETVTWLGGPIFGPDESEPHAAPSTASEEAASSVKGWRIT